MKANHQSKIHILLVEDNQDHADLIMKSLAKFLPKARFKHSTKHHECLNLVKKKKYDLVLMDFYLSGSPALELLQNLKKIHSDIPVIIVTGQGDEKTAAKSIKAGAEEYVEKTRDSLENLPQIILKILNQKQENKPSPVKSKNKKQSPNKHLKGVFDEFEHISTSLRSLYEKLNGKSENHKNKKGDLKKIPLLEKKVSGLKSVMMKLFSGGE